MAEEKSSPEKDKEQKPTAPEGGESGKAGEDPVAPSKLPKKLQGKSPDEIAKIYVELEKKLGKQSGEVKNARELSKQYDTMLKAIWSSPELYRRVEQGIQKYLKGDDLPEGRTQLKPGKGDEEDKGAKRSPEVSDLRKAEENRVLAEFYGKFGYNNLKGKERKDRMAKLAITIAELQDPGGKKPIKEILNKIPVTQLSKVLENAHFLANKEDLVKQGKRSALISQEENRAASIGSFPASSGKKGKGIALSVRERKAARKMGVSKEAYAKHKAQIEKEAEKYGG